MVMMIKCLGGLVQIKKPINFKRSAFGITGYAVVKVFRPLTILILFLKEETKCQN